MSQNTLKYNPRIAFDDPVVVAIDNNLDRSNRKNACKEVAKMHRKSIKRLKIRTVELGKKPADYVIIIANIDDNNGGEIAEMLMPRYDWDSAQKRGKVIYTVGLALRGPICEIISFIDKEAACKLKVANTTKVVVIDHGVADVY